MEQRDRLPSNSASCQHDSHTALSVVPKLIRQAPDKLSAKNTFPCRLRKAFSLPSAGYLIFCASIANIFFFRGRKALFPAYDYKLLPIFCQ